MHSKALLRVQDSAKLWGNNQKLAVTNSRNRQKTNDCQRQKPCRAQSIVSLPSELNWKTVVKDEEPSMKMNTVLKLWTPYKTKHKSPQTEDTEIENLDKKRKELSHFFNKFEKETQNKSTEEKN